MEQILLPFYKFKRRCMLPIKPGKRSGLPVAVRWLPCIPGCSVMVFSKQLVPGKIIKPVGFAATKRLKFFQKLRYFFFFKLFKGLLKQGLFCCERFFIIYLIALRF